MKFLISAGTVGFFKKANLFSCDPKFFFVNFFLFDSVLTDEVINQMNITNASCVIHFNFPGSKTQCGKRLTTLAGTFTSSEVPYR